MNIFDLKKINTKRGMTYVELIVVLSIFSIITSITLFNYRKFQEKVDVKNLANDVALKMVDSQKSSINGRIPLNQSPSINWKPSYGVKFVQATPKTFLQFVDINQDQQYDGPTNCPGGECVDQITITKSTYISSIDMFYQSGGSTHLDDLTVTFTRPDSIATFKSTNSFTSTPLYAQITLSSPQGIRAIIKVYAAGRVQIN